MPGADEPTVLIVDDEEDTADVFEIELSTDYDTMTAYSGSEALDKLDDTVDVVLLDRRMPSMPGDEVLDEIRRRGLDVRVAMVTAVDPDFDVVEMGLDAYLTKPVDDGDLREVIEELLLLSEYGERLQERFAVAQKRAALEAGKSGDELDQSQEYERLCQRESELEDVTAELTAEMDDDTFQKLFSNLPD